jgi:hypothetical protein
MKHRLSREFAVIFQFAQDSSLALQVRNDRLTFTLGGGGKCGGNKSEQIGSIFRRRIFRPFLFSALCGHSDCELAKQEESRTNPHSSTNFFHAKALLSRAKIK